MDAHFQRPEVAMPAICGVDGYADILPAGSQAGNSIDGSFAHTLSIALYRALVNPLIALFSAIYYTETKGDCDVLSTERFAFCERGSDRKESRCCDDPSRLCRGAPAL